MAVGCPSMCVCAHWLLSTLLFLMLGSPPAEGLKGTMEEATPGYGERATLTPPTLHASPILSEARHPTPTAALGTSATRKLTVSLSSVSNALVTPVFNGSLSPSLSASQSPQLSPTCSPTPSLEEIPDNMYTRTESCGLPAVNKCAENFCDCISREHSRTTNESWYFKNGAYRCRQSANTNCYYHLYCARERVSCLWSAAIWYKEDPNAVLALGGLTGLTQGSFGDEGCIGLENIYGNFSRLAQNTNYYDSIFYSECVDYVKFILQRTGGDICTTSIVPMYVCGASLFPLPPTRPIHYSPLSKGARRLVISIVARIVGNFTPVFAPAWNRNDEKHQLGREYLSQAMYRCFQNVIGIDGVFSMMHADDCLVVRYEVGVGEADPWVGDLVTANALNLMVRNASWMDPAQRVINNLTDSVNLSAPIVVYDVNFEPGQGQPEAKLCDAGCAVALALVFFLTLIAFIFSVVFCCRRPRQLYTIFERNYDSEEELENVTGRREIRDKRK
ncbi:uncharacterized protein Tco025E_00244 [Trypanosoma conorhini]|uniref:Uncharacterized protein n=1 Tax=Trypanosoma conorhini TaxID=83891 RepID=A0A3R7PM91_9TRYP|nr:uncharacterized protein Tco025E_00244 [Trypanosoma conorhini]RNF27508.1 hypothetical protein Tco025E_00244 [Trypanosoma conorhini]